MNFNNYKQLTCQLPTATVYCKPPKKYEVVAKEKEKNLLQLIKRVNYNPSRERYLNYTLILSYVKIYNLLPSYARHVRNL